MEDLKSKGEGLACPDIRIYFMSIVIRWYGTDAGTETLIKETEHILINVWYTEVVCQNTE